MLSALTEEFARCIAKSCANPASINRVDGFNREVVDRGTGDGPIFSRSRITVDILDVSKLADERFLEAKREEALGDRNGDN